MYMSFSKIVVAAVLVAGVIGSALLLTGVIGSSVAPSFAQTSGPGYTAPSSPSPP
jgi:hypothetical protein